MNRSHSPLCRIAVPGVFALALLAMAGCSKKLNTVDPNFIAPEGQWSANAHLVVQPDMPTVVKYYKLRAPNRPDDPDTLVSSSEVYPLGRGIMKGTIFDGTPAGSYQILRRESNGGYAPLFDFELEPVMRFPQSGWKLFTWTDSRPSGFQPATYMGRGMVNGVVTRTSPLTNVCLAGPTEPATIALSSDSLRTIGFTTVPGAVGYVLQVYKARNGYPDAEIWNAAPAIFATQDHRDALVEWIPATDGVPDLDHAQVLTWFGLAPAASYLIRMAAVDANGGLVGFSYGTPPPPTLKGPGKLDGPEENHYRMFKPGVLQKVVATVWENGLGLPVLGVTSTGAFPHRAGQVNPALRLVRH